MKVTVKVGKMSAKVNVSEDGVPGGIEWTFDGLETDTEINVAELPELTKQIAVNGEELRENLSAIRYEITTAVRDFKKMFEESQSPKPEKESVKVGIF